MPRCLNLLFDVLWDCLENSKLNSSHSVAMPVFAAVSALGWYQHTAAQSKTSMINMTKLFLSSVPGEM